MFRVTPARLYSSVLCFTLISGLGLLCCLIFRAVFSGAIQENDLLICHGFMCEDHIGEVCDFGLKDLLHGADRYLV